MDNDTKRIQLKYNSEYNRYFDLYDSLYSQSHFTLADLYILVRIARLERTINSTAKLDSEIEVLSFWIAKKTNDK